MFKLGNSEFQVKGASFYAGFSDDKMNVRMQCEPKNDFVWLIDIGMEYGPLITKLKQDDDEFDEDEYDDEYDDDKYEDDYDDYEEVSPRLYHNNGFSLDVRSWKAIEGMSKTWEEEYNENDEEAGCLCVFEHEDVTSGTIEFLKRQGTEFLIRWTGTANVYWDDEYGADVPFEFEGWIPFEGIYAGCDRISDRKELEEAMAEFIDISEFECVLEKNHKIEGGISYDWKYVPK